MARYLILAQSKPTAHALGVWLELLGERAVDDPQLDERVLLCMGGEHGIGAFETLSARLASDLQGASFAGRAARLTVLVDCVNLNNLNPLASEWNSLVARLILALPEVCWVFGVIDGEDQQTRCTEIRLWHGMASLLSANANFDPLLDGTGLRAWVMELARGGKVPKGTAQYLPVREQWAAALDDEVTYAYLHAYTAYRFGFRSFAVTTRRLAETLFGKEARELNNLALSLEDYYLGWPDKETQQHLSGLKERGTSLPGLDKLMASGDRPRRFFITSGHERSHNAEEIEANRSYRRQLCDEGRGGRELHKPLAGIFDLWRDSGLARALAPKNGSKRGYAPGFAWPPTENANSGTDGNHSAPGALLMVAEHLIARAEELLGSTRTLVEAVRGAVLATTALELLGPRTPTTARDALELRHRFEVLAECQFGGVQFNLDLRARFAEIRQSLELLARWYNRRSRDLALLNGEITIISRLMSIFQEYNEFDEEEKCLHHIRHLQRGVWLRREAPLSWVVWPFRAYVEYLMGSPVRFFSAVFLWLAGLTVVFFCLFQGRPPDDIKSPPLSYAIQITFNSFFGSQPALDNSNWVIFWTTIAAMSGFVHLGIFISRLYALISRK